jgi:3-hydroxyacyl-CoA dehydrogenase
MEIRKAGVVGCGQMGGGVAHICAQFGFEMVAREISVEAIAKRLNAKRELFATLDDICPDAKTATPSTSSHPAANITFDEY